MSRSVVWLLCVIAALACALRVHAEEPVVAQPSPADVPTAAPEPDASAAPSQSEGHTVPLESPAFAEVQRRLAHQDEELRALRAEMASQKQPVAPKVRVSGFIQTDWIVLSQASQDEINPSTGLPLNQDRFVLRRGHLRAENQGKWFGASLEIDANTTRGLQVRPINAEASVRFPATPDDAVPYVVASVGLVRIPFGFEVQELDYARPFLERAQVLRALYPGEFDLGARLVARYRFLELAAALMNGHPIGELGFPALSPNHEKDIAGRLGTKLGIVSGVTLNLGVSANGGTGFHPGSAMSKDQLTWRDDNGDGMVQATEIQVLPGHSATASQKFHRYAVGADARITMAIPALGMLSVRAEVVQAVNLDRGLEPADPIGAGYDLRELGWYAGFTQDITEYAAIGFRYDRYNPDEDASDAIAAARVPRDRTYSTAAFMALVRYDNARLTVEYDKNGNALGRTASGISTTLKSDLVTIRGQVTF